MRSAHILKVNIEDEAAEIIAERSRKTPRVANRLLKRVRDYAQVKKRGKITNKEVREAMDLLEVDSLGLEAQDRQMLKDIIAKFGGGPVGIKTISASLSEDPETIEEVYEPYLIRLGLLEKTARGRIATPLAYEHLGLQNGEEGQNKLL